MSTRNRMTWAAGRSASAPPAIPGYGKEDQDHPAHQADPAYEAYKKGDPSAWAEDPHKAPYPQGNPPALPGYDVEDQDHPAHKEQPRVPKEARDLRAAVERKAQKCCRIARHLLGKKASQQAVEDQALDMMDWADSRIEATLQRLAGGFLAEESHKADFFDEGFDEFDMAPVEDVGFPGDDDLDLLLAEEVPEVAPQAGEIDGLLAEIRALTAKVEGLKSAAKTADQNDPNGKTLAPTPKSEEQARKEAKKAEGEDEDKEEAPKEETAARKAARKFFASMDHDRDGFVMEADWTGAKDLFAALDTDGDGILAAAEVIDTLAPAPASAPVLANFTPEETAMLASMEAAVLKQAAKKKAEDDEEAEEPKAAKKGGKKSEVEVEEEVEASKKGGKKKAKKAEDEDEDGDEEPKAAKKATAKKAEDEGDDKPEDDEGEEESESDDDGDDGDEETASKKACGEDDAGMFGMSGDPMGLADGSEEVLGEDDALLAEIFGGKKAGEDEESDEGEEEPSKEASKKSEDEEEVEVEDDPAAAKKAMRLASRQAPQRPQPRKASANGVRTVGGLTRTASAGGEVDELSRLWESAPDVSKVFNG